MPFAMHHGIMSSFIHAPFPDYHKHKHTQKKDTGNNFHSESDSKFHNKMANNTLNYR